MFFVSSCITFNTHKNLDLIPDKIEARYKVDTDFNGTGYEFTAGWNIK